MKKTSKLIAMANEFVTERNWWQFHNPKNDAMNILVETGELAELFIENNKIVLNQNKIAEEISDVLFASFCFVLLTKVDIANTISQRIGGSALKDIDSYEQLQELVLQNLDKFNLNNLAAPQQVVLSLTGQASQLGDIFAWYTTEQSITRAQEKHFFIQDNIAHIVAHLIYLSSLVAVNLPMEYISKMQKNCSKYPANKSSGQDYIEIKDRSRGR